MKHSSLALFGLYVMTQISVIFGFVVNFDSTRASCSLGRQNVHSSSLLPLRRRHFLQPSLLLLSKDDNESDYRNSVYGVNAQRGPLLLGLVMAVAIWEFSIPGMSESLFLSFNILYNNIMQSSVHSYLLVCCSGISESSIL